MTNLITKLKENDEDFEFYPTTQEIVNALQEKLKSCLDCDYYGIRLNKVLDIGCGMVHFSKSFVKMKNSKMFKNLVLKNQTYFMNNYPMM